MIDVEVDIFDELARAILDEYPEAFVSSEYVEAPPQFPAVSIIETNNVTNESTEDSSGEEVMAAITYTVDVYSDSQSDAKQECKAILNVVDQRMRKCNMTRLMSSTVDNARDPTVYRLIARYTGLVDRNLVMYRR